MYFCSGKPMQFCSGVDRGPVGGAECASHEAPSTGPGLMAAAIDACAAVATGHNHCLRDESIPSTSAASCGAVSRITPSLTGGHLKAPCSSRFQNRISPEPSHARILSRSARSGSASCRRRTCRIGYCAGVSGRSWSWDPRAGGLRPISCVQFRRAGLNHSCASIQLTTYHEPCAWQIATIRGATS
jgi:hypothetical protein